MAAMGAAQTSLGGQAPNGFPRGDHIDAQLDVDTQVDMVQDTPKPLTVLKRRPSSNWITGARHGRLPSSFPVLFLVYSVIHRNNGWSCTTKKKIITTPM